MSKRLLRLLLTALLALSFAGTAFAQTTGTIIGVVTDASTGKPVAGALVVATSPNLQGEQTAVTDNGGNFRVTLLPPGQYKLAVQLEGFKPAERSDVTVRLDKTIRANLAIVPEAVQLEEQVVRTGTAPVINVGSAETGAVVSREFVAGVPVGRDFEDVAIVAPTAVADTYGFSLAGAQSPETNYILDGMNVTDPRYGTNGAVLLSNFVEEVDIKTGNFGAEYGRATGGIVNVVTKSGSNEYHGSLFANFTPRMWIDPQGAETGRNNEAIGARSDPSQGAYDLDLGFEVGGPIMKDKLWFYAGFAPVLTQDRTARYLRVRNAAAGTNTEIPGTRQIIDGYDNSYQYTGKLTYLLNENNNVTLSLFGAPGSRSTLDPNAGEGWTNGYIASGPGGSGSVFEANRNLFDVIGTYNGKFLDKRMILTVQGGYHTQSQDPTDRSGSLDTLTMQYRFSTNLSNFEPVPAVCSDPGNTCRVNRYFMGGYGFVEKYSTSRVAGKAALSYLFDAGGSHNLKAGVDVERNDYDQNAGYSGGSVWRIYDFDGNGVPDTTWRYRGRGTVANLASDNASDVTYLNRQRALAVTTSTAFYLQDNFSPFEGLQLNAGLRWELQSMRDKDSAASPEININDNIGPRLQAIYDWTGTGRSKVSASWGRFYEMIPLDMAARAFGNETSVWDVYDVTACTSPPAGVNPAVPGSTPYDPVAAGCPVIDQGPTAVLGLTNPYGESATYLQSGGVSPVDPNIKGMFVDQFGAGVEYEVLPDLSVGLEYQGRRLGRAIEDMSSNDGVTYFIANPGESDPFNYSFPMKDGTPGNFVNDAKNSQTIDPFTHLTYNVRMPKPIRKYDGFTFKVAKNFSRNWLMQGSYTYSVLQGNYPGLFRPENDQLDPNLTSEYDLPTLMTNKKGLLPGDMTHQFKLFGAYNWAFTQRFNVTTGASFRYRSGTPVSALGAHPIYGASEAFIIPRGMAGRTDPVTKLDLKGQLEYVIRAPYAFRVSVDLFNVFNSQEKILLDENYTDDTVQPIVGMDCGGRNAVNKSGDPIANLQADCPGLAYLKTTDGLPVTPNTNFGRAQNVVKAFATPFSMRIGVGLTF